MDNYNWRRIGKDDILWNSKGVLLNSSILSRNRELFNKTQRNLIDYHGYTYVWPNFDDMFRWRKQIYLLTANRKEKLYSYVDVSDISLKAEAEVTKAHQLLIELYNYYWMNNADPYALTDRDVRFTYDSRSASIELDLRNQNLSSEEFLQRIFPETKKRNYLYLLADIYEFV